MHLKRLIIENMPETFTFYNNYIVIKDILINTKKLISFNNINNYTEEEFLYYYINFQ